MISQAFLAVLAAAALFAAGAAQAQSSAPPLPFEIARLQKDFPVTLYTAPNCKEPCEKAREALNKRSVPFSEVQVVDDETIQKAKSLSGADQLPVLTVGRSALSGFEQGQYDDLLNTSGYPPAGRYPARNQAAPDGNAKPAATAQKPAPRPKTGPYDTGGLVGPAPKTGPYDPSGLQGPAPKTGPYDPSRLQGPAPKTGPYGVPAESQ